MKRFLAAFLTLALLLTSLAAVASADYERSGQDWTWEDGKYYLADAKTGEKIDAPAGWFKATLVESYDDGYTYTWDWWAYIEADGSMAYGWKQIGGVWYYFWPDMETNSWYDEDKDTVYLFSESGAWTGISSTGKGWINVGNKWYYIYKYTEEYDGGSYTWAQFYSNGNYEIDDKIYYFKDGVMQDNGWVSNKYTYNGRTYTDWFYANKNGELATGWKKIDGTWYCFSDYGWMYSDRVVWDYDDDTGDLKAIYAFAPSGAMISNKWYQYHWTDYSTGEVHYDDSWLYLGADGAAKTGWFQVGKTWYYGGEYGWIWMNSTLTDKDGKTYYFDKTGAMATGWQQPWAEWGYDAWFYFKADGSRAEKEWIKDGNTWYYLGEYGEMYADGTYTIDGKEYKFDKNGAWVE